MVRVRHDVDVVVCTPGSGTLFVRREKTRTKTGESETSPPASGLWPVPRPKRSPPPHWQSPLKPPLDFNA